MVLLQTKPIDETLRQTESSEKWDIEWRLCQKNPKYFLTSYAWILNRNTGKIVKWEPWPYHLDLLDIIEYFNDIILLKARQLGWSWLVAGWGLSKVEFNEGAKGLYISQGEKEAWDLLGKSKFIHNHLPDQLRSTLKHSDNKERIDFTVSDSVIEALASTDKAGRSTDATFVIRDELAKHPYGSDNFASVRPTIDSGGKSIDLSTIEKGDADNHFTERVQRAMSGAVRKDLPSGLVVYYGGESGATLVFGGWKLRPVRQEGLTQEEWWQLRVVNSYTQYVREQEYPETIEEALSEHRLRAYFDVNATDSMLMDLGARHLSQDEVPEVNMRGGLVHIYKKFVVGDKYIMYTDPSNGVEDPFHTVVLHARTYEGVAEANGMVKTDECAQIHDDLARYFKAYNTYDATGYVGGKFEESIKNLKTPYQAERRDPSGKIIKDRMGWWTSEPMKRLMLTGLEEAVRKHLIISHERATIDELKSMFVPMPPHPQEPQVPKGRHDDRIMAWGGVWQLRKYVQVGDIKVTSFKYRD